MSTYREKWLAGVFIQRGFGTGVNSFRATQVSSYLSGTSAWRGIATISSGTTVATVSAAAVRSGDVVHATIYNYATIQDSIMGVAVNSVGTGQFLIQTAGSKAVASPMPVAWSVLR